MPLGGDPEEKGRLNRWRLSLEEAVQATFWALQPWRPTKEGRAPLAGWRASGTNRRTVGSLDSAREECTNACLLLKQGGGAGLKPRNWLTGFPWSPWCVAQPELSKHSSTVCLCCSSTLEWGLLWLRKMLSWEMLLVTQTLSESEHGGGSHSWWLTDQVSDDSLTTTTCTLSSAEQPHHPSCYSTASLWGWGCWCFDGHWAEEKPFLTPGSSPSTSSSSLTSYHGDSCQHSLRKDLTCVHIKFSSASKDIGHMQTV